MIAATADPGLARVHAHLAEMGLGALSLYKVPCFGRRLALRLRACGDTSVEAYADRLDQEPAERERLVAALSIGVTAFFRNPEAWRRLAAAIDAAGPMERFQAWNAGCSTGEEAYSTALLIHRLAERGTLGDWRVVATDIDQQSLAIAREGRYPRRDLAAIEAVVGPIEAAVDDRTVQFPATLRSRIAFRRADLTRPGPVHQFDLVSCRNVLIYFGPAGQEQVVANLVQALRPGGLLMLGKAELAAGAASAGLDVVDRRERIYRRVA